MPIPEAPTAPATQPQQQPPGQQTQLPSPGALQSDPQMQQMIQLIQQNPQLLQPLLQQMGINNPELAQVHFLFIKFDKGNSTKP